MTGPLKGVIAAIPTPFDGDGDPDVNLFVTFARHLLDDGCDALNVCGTTGEATSMSTAQRKRLMTVAAESLPAGRMMVGTGTSSVAETADLTRHAQDLGFAGALLLPPFYYKGVSDEGIVDGFERIADHASSIPLYLYNFPALSGVTYTRTLVETLRSKLPGRVRGLKDSSGDMTYAADLAAIRDFDIFPSNEATLIDAADGRYAGCISATANLSAPWCAKAYANADEAALSVAVAIRKTVSAGPLIPGVKAAIAGATGEPSYAAMLPPLVSLPEEAADALRKRIARLKEGVPD